MLIPTSEFLTDWFLLTRCLVTRLQIDLLFAIAALVAALAGCKAGPNYIRPAACVSEAWSYELQREVNADRQVDSQWWRGFQDPVLDSLIQQSLQQNLTLQEAAALIFETRAQRSVARGGLFPDFYSETNYQRIKVSNNGTAFGFNLNRPPFDFWRSGFDMSWEVNLFGAVRRSIEAANADIDAAVENRRDIMVTLLGDVAANYVQLRVLQARYEFANQNATLQKQTLDIAQAKLDQDLASSLDPLQAATNWRQTRPALPVFERDQQLVLNRLCVLQSRPVYNLMDQVGYTPQIPRPPANVAVGIPADLVRRRPDIRRAERELAAQSARIGIATADLYPRLSIAGVFTYDTTAIRQWIVTDSIAYRVSPILRWNLLSFGRVRGNIDVQDARYQQAVARYCQVVVTAIEEVESSIASFTLNRDQADELEKAVEAARDAAELAELRYIEGLTSFEALLIAQRQLTTLQDELVQATGSVTLSLIALYKALGGGWQGAA